MCSINLLTQGVCLPSIHMLKRSFNDLCTHINTHHKRWHFSTTSEVSGSCLAIESIRLANYHIVPAAKVNISHWSVSPARAWVRHCKFLTEIFIIFVELDPQNHQEESLHNLRRGLLQVLWRTGLCDSALCVGAMRDNLLILAHLTVTAAAASVEATEMLMPRWRSATTSAQLLSITGTAPSTPLNIPLMPLGSCILQGPARGTATWVDFPQS